jgi:hypothetical protein
MLKKAEDSRSHPALVTKAFCHPPCAIADWPTNNKNSPERAWRIRLATAGRPVQDLPVMEPLGRQLMVNTIVMQLLIIVM